MFPIEFPPCLPCPWPCRWRCLRSSWRAWRPSECTCCCCRLPQPQILLQPPILLRPRTLGINSKAFLELFLMNKHTFRNISVLKHVRNVIWEFVSHRCSCLTLSLKEFSWIYNFELSPPRRLDSKLWKELILWSPLGSEKWFWIAPLLLLQPQIRPQIRPPTLPRLRRMSRRVKSCPRRRWACRCANGIS